MNRIAINPDLANVDYTDLLDKILRVLKNQQIFIISADNKRVKVDINEVVNEVIKLTPHNPLGNQKAARSATLNFTPGTEVSFREKIRQITGYIQYQLTLAIQQNPNSKSMDRFEFIQNLLTDLQTFQTDRKPTKLDLSYEFLPSKNLQKQRLTVKKDDKAKQKQLLKAHKVKISVDKPKDFYTALLTGLNNFIDINFSSSSDREEIGFILENLKQNTKSDIYQLQNLVNQETLGKLKKLSQIKYLEFLLENIDEKASSKNYQAKIYLQDLIRRLQILEDYINNPNKADGEYEVSYAQEKFNLQTVFSRGDAYDKLPIIPLVEGYLGESEHQHQEKIEFTFGLKLKFDGKVQTDGGKNVFQRNLDILLADPNSEENIKEFAENLNNKKNFVNKVLKIAFLYYFIFASTQDPKAANYDPREELNYDPLRRFEKDILSVFKGDDENAKKELLGKLKKGFDKFKVQKKVDILKEVLTNLIKRETPFPERQYPVHISVKNSILENDIETITERDTLFKNTLRGNFKDCLKYIHLGNPSTQTNILVTLPANITISEIHFLETPDVETFDMEYDITSGIKVLPAIFLGIDNQQCRNFYESNLKNRNLLVFPHRLEEQKLEKHQEFIYKIVYSLLAYLCLHVILERQIKEDAKPFIPLIRIHLKEKTDETAIIEKFIVDLTKVLSHLLNERYRCNEQGIVVTNPKTISFKIPNVLSSLYSVVPKKFTFLPTDNFRFQELNKLAIIVVSSRESDRRFGVDEKKSNLIGEIITIQTEDNKVRFQLFKTFSENYDDHQKMFEYPTVVVDNVDKLYKRGYRHFIYIAKVPYSSTLHITQAEKDEELFFMSQNVIQSLKKERHDIKIYPMFFEKYYAVKVGNFKSTSLYIQDTLELTNLAEDRNKQSVIFFNLFNGLQVAKEVNYHGVMSYATLYNMYESTILDDKDIFTGLIDNESKLKNEITQCLTLFHFSRYEKSEKSGNMQLKLDPYQNLIGDESVSESASFKHIRDKTDFNSLAFLTHVKSILLGKDE
ncbi:hypothetical protein [Sphaerospermopsis sp. FACHB-1194]|uniref:hypothetical protein n=1 Tax=Sphaerospermopsis sp. FACHB-1194 TaxID=2692862 RepID=UPI00168138DA|nr:hypothetical protein [Sphaerospermopsis sp. FACHB-1194]MBD2147003.1 hypothetical protein [Sphaerospermopsis sp. FACHB-1194]